MHPMFWSDAMTRKFMQRCVALVAVLAAIAVPGRAAAQCFAESGACISGRFAEYWQQHGGLAVFGVSLSEPAAETSPLDGVSRTAQWFERHRFEHHPDNAAPYDVLLGRLGEDRLRQLGRDWRTEAAEAGPSDGCAWFEQTAHTLCDQEAGAGFLSYWRANGLELDGAAGYSFEESLALFGQPLTAVNVEVNASGHAVATQWFERARFEWHADRPVGSRVLLGLLGSELRGWQPPERKPEPVQPAPSGPLARMAAMVDRLHQQSCGEPYRRDERLTRAAQAHAEDIARHRRIDHVGTDGATLHRRLERVGYPARFASESIAIYQTPEESVHFWMAEPPNGPHRLNIVNCQYVDNGFGLAVDSRGRNWWVMDVANRR